jgi:hypothetical protein
MRWLLIASMLLVGCAPSAEEEYRACMRDVARSSPERMSWTAADALVICQEASGYARPAFTPSARWVPKTRERFSKAGFSVEEIDEYFGCSSESAEGS